MVPKAGFEPARVSPPPPQARPQRKTPEIPLWNQPLTDRHPGRFNQFL